MIFTQLRVLINEERWETPFSLNGVSHLRRDYWGSGLQIQALHPPFSLPPASDVQQDDHGRAHAAETITRDAFLRSHRGMWARPH